MENSSTLDMDVLINVLNQGNDHIRELRAQLDKPGSAETCISLARQAQSAFAAAIGMAKLSKHTPSTNPDFSYSPLSTSDSARSEGSDQKAFKEQGRREMCKTKRKAMPRWSRHVRVCSAAGSSMEGPVGDGYSWRKYGQKDILGSKFPRGYYRCTHRHTHGCLATKQVQRSDVDLAVFQVSYRGAHTCTRDRLSILPSGTSPHEEQSLQQNTTPTKTNCLISDDQQPRTSPSFSFPLMRTESGLKPDNAHFMESYNSPAFMTTAAASTEMSFSLPLCGPSSVGGPDICCSGNSEMAEMLSAAASDFGLEHIVFDTDHFPFEF